MNFIGNFLKHRYWLVFLIHQLILLVSAVGFLNLVRLVSGKNIHLGQDEIGLFDGIGIVLLSIGIIFFTRFFYRWTTDDSEKDLGVELSFRRFVQLLIGLLIGFIFIISPFLLAIFNGTAFVGDSITAHFDHLTAFRLVTVGFVLLLLQSITEETANRAFPLMLWKNYSLLFRLIVPSAFFALIHLASENFSFERILILILGGLLQSLAFLLTENIWFSSGIHTGMNFSLFSMNGVWHSGASVAVMGAPAYSNFWAVFSIFIFLGILFEYKIFSRKTKKTDYA